MFYVEYQRSPLKFHTKYLTQIYKLVTVFEHPHAPTYM